MSGDGKDTVSSTPAGSESAAVPQYARSIRHVRPPAKAFMSKPFSARTASISAAKPAPGTLLDRLHGKGPLVKWPAGKPGSTKITVDRSTIQRASVSPPHSSPDVIMSAAATNPAPATKRENMSERFITERLLSGRGTSNFNPQIPRRIPDIPSPSSIKAVEADSDGKRLMIGKLVSLSGELGGCERLIVEGKVDVTLKDVKVLEVGAQGLFKGTAAVETAVIVGNFEGTLRVSGHLDVGPGAVVKGTVSYGTIAVASGGKLLGTIESLETSAI